MALTTKQHIIFDEDVTEFLQKFTDKTGFPSVTFSAHHLLRMIKSAEITIDVELKDNVPMPAKAGVKPIVFRKKIRMKMKL
jgi:hypothetical protein